MKRAGKIILQVVLFAAVCYAAAYGASYMCSKYDRPKFYIYAM